MSMRAPPEKYRLKLPRTNPYYSDASYGVTGAWQFGLIRVIASDGEGWEHVSVSLQDRAPRWKEMCRIKDMFWDAEDCVVQFHPPKSQYVNNHPHCLHLWRPTDQELPMPDPLMVGDKGLSVRESRALASVIQRVSGRAS